MHDDDMPSMEQVGWESLTATIRRKLVEAAECVPAMKPEELSHFMAAVREAYWMEVGAKAFDVRVQMELQKTVFSN